MKCPSCFFENPAGIEFCGKCGAKLGLFCPHCNSPSPQNFTFCGTERGLTRFVGRQEELEFLVRSLEQAKAGRGQAVSIIGEAGVGKSRLVYEFRKVLANEDILFLEGRCLSYGRADAYHPIADILKSNFEIHDEDRDPEIREKVEKGLATLGRDKIATLPYILELLSVKKSGIDSVSMSAAAKTDRILGSLLRMVLKRSEERPLVLVLEDLHWIDKSSEESAKHLVQNISAARILMILTYRPDFVHTWGSKSFHSRIELNRLSNRESVSMVSHILGSADVSMDITNLILQKAKGVPFFIEEFVRALKDMEVISRKLSYNLSRHIDWAAIPSTIQDVIMARVDSLPDPAKEVLQAGSAIDREFSFKLIQAVTDLPELPLLSYLSALMYAELIYERGVFPESTYIFKHAIVREVIYDLIPATRKKLLHQGIGKAIEELYQDKLDGYYAVLADHFMLGEDFQKSADYSKLTCERARRQAAITSALSYAEKRITALDRMGSTTQVDVQLIDARTYYGLTLFMAGDHAKSKEAIEPIIATAANSDDKRCIAQIYLILGSYEYIVRENLAQAFQLLQKATQNAEEAGDIASGTLAQMFYGLALCWDCEFKKGAEHIQKALFINEAASVLWGVSVIKSYLSYYVYNHQGKLEEGFATSLSALEIAERAGDVFSRSMAYVFHGVSCFYKGLFTAAEEHLLKGIDLCERIKLDSVSAIGHQILGHVYFETGNYNKARIHHKKVILLRRQTGIFPSSANLSKMALARSMLAAGGKDLDVPSLVQLLKTNKLRLCYGLMARDLAAILVRLGEVYYDEAELWLQIAIRDHEGVGMKWALASDYRMFAQMCRLLGWEAQEKEYLDKSRLLFHECGAEGWCRRMETDMTETSK